MVRSLSLMLAAALTACSADKVESTGCDSDDDCARTDLESTCLRHVCRAGSCATEPREAPAPSGFLVMFCTRLVCVDGGIGTVGDITNKPPDTQCTVYTCEGTTLVTHELTGGGCPGPADGGSDAGAD